MIKQYKITYINDLGEETQATVVASSKSEAMNRLGVTRENFVYSKVDYQFSQLLKINTQLQILNRVLGGVSSGEPHKRYLPSILDDFRELKKKKGLIDKKINEGLPLSQLLAILEINPTCVSLIENGERSGKISDSIKNAKDFLRLENKTKKSTIKTLKSQFLILLLALFFTFVFPVFVFDFLTGIQESGIKITTNISTDILYFLAKYGFLILAILVFIVFLIVFKKQLFFQLFEKIYPVSIFQNIIKSKAAILFLSIFAPLFKSGMKTEQILYSYSALHKNNADKIKQSILEGVAISDSVQDLDFSNTFKSGFKGFNTIANKEIKIHMLDELFDSIVEDIETYSSQAASLIKITSNVLIYTILMILMHGFIMPQLTMGVGL